MPENEKPPAKRVDVYFLRSVNKLTNKAKTSGFMKKWTGRICKDTGIIFKKTGIIKLKTGIIVFKLYLKNIIYTQNRIDI